jgi:hypothetical protein
VRNEFSPFRLAVCAVCLLSLFGLRANAQDRDKDRKSDHPDGIVQDWSRHHVVFPRVGPIQSLIAVQHDRRAILGWQEAEREDWHRARDRDRDRDWDRDRDHRHVHGTLGAIHTDWSISLGGGTTALAMYPAKFTFDINATPNCLTDFIVFPVNVAGGASQPNIVGFNNLYSGTAGGAGICNAPANGRTTGVGDDGVSATTVWSYNVTAGGGVVATSPALSIDGTKVAFVETGGAGAAHFHVLAPNNGDGVAANLQTVTSPAQITSGFVIVTPAAGQATDLALGSANDTLSSPFVDYVNDTAYIGNDAGVLFRVKDVFCTTAACTGGGSPAPSLDTTWGSGGLVTIGGTCTGKLTGAVTAINGSVYVGCADGKLYGFDSTGAPFTPTASITVGDGSATGGIVDPPLVDVVNKFIYVVSGNNVSAKSVIVQAASDFSSSVTATLGAGGNFNLHLPFFNEAYFTSGFSSVANVQGTTMTNGTTGSTSNWQIYEWADSGVVGARDTLYGVGFDSSHNMTSGPASNFLEISLSTASEFSPVAEILNGSVDHIYASGLTSSTPNLLEYNVTDFAGLFPNVLFPFNSTNAAGGSASEGSGTTGIVVDNVSALAQASSIYFGVPSLNTAVKLTQGGLQ